MGKTRFIKKKNKNFPIRHEPGSLKLSYIQIFPFRGNMAFLSAFHPCFVKVNGYIFKSLVFSVLC